MPTLLLKAITCRKTQEAIDEPYLLGMSAYGGRLLWGPEKMDSGESKVLDIELDFDEFAQVDLYECEGRRRGIRDDLIGRFSVTQADVGEHEIVLPNWTLMPVGKASYSLTYEVIDDAAPQPRRRYRVELISLECKDAQERSDSVYILINDRKVWGPEEMRSGRTRAVNACADFRDFARVEIWEEDPARSDIFGSFRIDADDVVADTSLTQDFLCRGSIVGSAHYVLNYRVVQLPGS